MRVVQGYRPVIMDNEEDEVISISDSSSSDEQIISEDKLLANTVKRRKIDHTREVIVHQLDS